MSDKLRRNKLWAEFEENLSAIVREFTKEEIDSAVEYAIEDYLIDMEHFDVVRREHETA